MSMCIKELEAAKTPNCPSLPTSVKRCWALSRIPHIIMNAPTAIREAVGLIRVRGRLIVQKLYARFDPDRFSFGFIPFFHLIHDFVVSRPFADYNSP